MFSDGPPVTNDLLMVVVPHDDGTASLVASRIRLHGGTGRARPENARRRCDIHGIGAA